MLRFTYFDISKMTILHIKWVCTLNFSSCFHTSKECKGSVLENFLHSKDIAYLKNSKLQWNSDQRRFLTATGEDSNMNQE